MAANVDDHVCRRLRDSSAQATTISTNAADHFSRCSVIQGRQVPVIRAQRAKSEHLALALAGTGAWSAELTAAYKDAVRSVNRGVGIARQSKPLDTLAVAGLCLPDAPLVTGGPVAPGDFVVAGTFFMLREVEITSARYEHVTVSADGSSANWLLPTSKTDHKAVGVCRSWDCTCAVPGLEAACPVHALMRQKALSLIHI